GLMCLNLYWRSSRSLPSRFPKPAMYGFTEPCSFARSKIVLAFSNVARIFFSFRTIPESCINARMSRSESRATFSGEKSRNAFRKAGHFFSTICQFKPALKIALDIRSRYPWSSFGGPDFHPGMGTPTLLSLFIPTFAAALAPSCGPSGCPGPPPRSRRRRSRPSSKVDRMGSEPQPRGLPGNWVVRNRIVRSQAVLAAPVLYASCRSFSKNHCVVPAGPFVVEFREQLLRLLPGRRGRPAVQVGSKSDEPGACEPVGEALEEIRQTPPCVEDQDARSAAFLRDGQESRDLAFGALEFNHSHVLTSIRRKARPNRRVGLSVCSNGRTTPSTRLLGMSFLMPRRPGPL